VFGGNVFGWTTDERTSFSILDTFVDHGLDFIDTADSYSQWAEDHQGGESETIIGKWFKESGKRDKIVLATKVGMLRTRPGLSAANIEAAVNESLRRLQTDYIDVCFSHLDDDKTPFEETLGAYDKLIKAGKVRVIGASNFTGERLKAALKVSKEWGLPAYEVLQPEYNLYDRESYETDLEPVAQAHKLTVVTAQRVYQDRRQTLCNPCQHGWYCVVQRRAVLAHHFAVFGQQATRTVDLHRAELNQLLPHPVQCQHHLLCFSLDRDRPARLLRTASQIACASAASFLFRMLNALANSAGISLRWCPILVSARAQCCAPPHASMPIRRAVRFAEYSRNFARLIGLFTISPVSPST
jgi:diketogulonate reductase-like aldo/keto reductase